MREMFELAGLVETMFSWYGCFVLLLEMVTLYESLLISALSASLCYCICEKLKTNCQLISVRKKNKRFGRKHEKGETTFHSFAENVPPLVVKATSPDLLPLDSVPSAVCCWEKLSREAWRLSNR